MTLKMENLLAKHTLLINELLALRNPKVKKVTLIILTLPGDDYKTYNIFN